MCVWSRHNGQCNTQSLRLIDRKSPGSQDSRRTEAKLKQRTTGCQIRKARGNNVKSSKWSSPGNLEHRLCTLLHKRQKPWSHESRTRIDLRIRDLLHEDNLPKAPGELTRNMYPLWNQALRHEEYTQTANRNCQVQGARECSVQFPNVASSRKQLKHRLRTGATSGSENTIT